ncbi:MAG: LTA synthase family protein [Desulfoprunum sp.]|nr:LTA synthase family protein [Desulfoprunum sp.]
MPNSNRFSASHGSVFFLRCLQKLLFNRYVIFYLLLFGYTQYVEYLGGLKGGKVFFHQYLDRWLILYLYWYLNAIVRPSRWQPFLAAAPIFLAYIGQDIYYSLLGKVFRFIELTEAAELFNVIALKYLLLIILAGAIPLFGFLYTINYRRVAVIVLGCLPLVFLVGFVELYPEAALQAFKKVGREVINWSDGIPVEQNGRFAMLWYREAERKIAVAKTDLFRDRQVYEKEAGQRVEWLKEKGSKRDVHVVVMESFVDPTLFKGATYTKDPAHPDYRKLFGNKLGFSVSPVFGGKTSQAEFEVLCGVPAFQELGGVEFNSFSGVSAYCLPGILGLAGYRTIASNSFKPTFFNAVNAYEGIGFGEMYFPKEYTGDSSSYLSTGDTTGEMYMFDGVLFNQNLQFIKDAVSDEDAPPLFNYVLTMYGHLPHVLNKDKRPNVLKLVSRFRDPQLERVANQFFYRSQAVADYVKKLIDIDKNSLIIIVSDHLPPLQGQTTYQKLGYLDNREDSIHLNRILIIEDGKVKKYTLIHHYDVPKIILNYLTKGEYCRGKTCGFVENKFIQDRATMHDQYLRLMAHAIQ